MLCLTTRAWPSACPPIPPRQPVFPEIFDGAKEDGSSVYTEPEDEASVSSGGGAAVWVF